MRFDPSIFISYAEEDLEIAEKLYHDLKNKGVNPWLDKEDIIPGQKKNLAIDQAIKDSSYFLLLFSSDSLSKQSFIQKRTSDLLEELHPFDIFIIPVRLDDCRLDDKRFEELQWVDLFPSYDKGLKQILRVFTTPKKINIDQYFDDLKEQHRSLKKEFKELGDKADLTKAKKLLNEIRIAGKFITNLEQRIIITDLARDLGEIIFEASEEYPPVRLEPHSKQNADKRR